MLWKLITVIVLPDGQEGERLRNDCTGHELVPLGTLICNCSNDDMVKGAHLGI